MFALYLDENRMDGKLIATLRNKRANVISTLERGLLKATDEEQLEYSTGQERVLYTENMRHFCPLHSQWLREGKQHAGIIVVQQLRYSPGEQARRLMKMMAAFTAEEMRSRLEFLSNW